MEKQSANSHCHQYSPRLSEETSSPRPWSLNSLIGFNPRDAILWLGNEPPPSLSGSEEESQEFPESADTGRSPAQPPSPQVRWEDARLFHLSHSNGRRS